MMVLTAKFGCARLYSRIIAPDTSSRRCNLQACYAEYQWIIAYAQKFEVKVFQEELALCREMVSAPAADSFLPFSFLFLVACRVSLANRRRSFQRKSLPFHRKALYTLLHVGDVA